MKPIEEIQVALLNKLILVNEILVMKLSNDEKLSKEPFTQSNYDKLVVEINILREVLNK